MKVVIANPETKGMCADSHLGEVRYVIVTKRTKISDNQSDPPYYGIIATGCTAAVLDISVKRKISHA